MCDWEGIPLTVEKSESNDWKFSGKEVKRSVFNLHEDMAPAPKGLSLGFFQESRDITKADLMKVFEELFENGSICKGINSTFLVLIQKREGQRRPKDFRPISLV